MDSSTLALIFFIALIVFFVLLVICTISYFVSKSKKEQDRDDEYPDEEDIQNEKVKTIKQEIQPKQEKENKIVKDEVISKKSDKEKIDNVFADSAFTDSAFTDSAFTDGAFTDSAFTDSAFTDSAFTDSAFTDSVFSDKVPKKAEESDKTSNDFIKTVKFDYNNISDDKTVDENKKSVDDYQDSEDDYDDSDPITDELVTPGLLVKKEVVEKTEEKTETKPEVENVINENNDNQTNESTDTSIPESNNVETINNEIDADSAFSESYHKEEITNEFIEESVKEAEAMVANVMKTDISAETMFDISDAMSQYGKKKTQKAINNVLSSDDFYWYNKMDVAQKPSYKTAEMYYHHFEKASECIEDLLIEMYDCALVRTEEIKYIAYGIEPKTISMKEIMALERQGRGLARVKEPTAQDLVRIYEKWCGYVDKLFDKVEIHADEATIGEIRKLLCEFGKSDVDVLIEGM